MTDRRFILTALLWVNLTIIITVTTQGPLWVRYVAAAAWVALYVDLRRNSRKPHAPDATVTPDEPAA